MNDGKIVYYVDDDVYLLLKQLQKLLSYALMNVEDIKDLRKTYNGGIHFITRIEDEKVFNVVHVNTDGSVILRDPVENEYTVVTYDEFTFSYTD